MTKEQDIIRWVADICEFYNIEIGPHVSSHDLGTWETTARCFGCLSEQTYTSTESFKMGTFKHEPDCRYVILMDIAEKVRREQKLLK